MSFIFGGLPESTKPGCKPHKPGNALIELRFDIPFDRKPWFNQNSS